MKVKVFLLLLFIFFASANCWSQQNEYYHDSVITYQMISTDTAGALPVKKETYLYEKDLRIKEKNVFRWDRKRNEWIKEKKYKVSYYTKEVSIECYDIENGKQEILASRNVILINDDGKMVESTLYSKGRYNDKYERRNQYTFEYKNDTLVKKVYFEQSTTFFKKTEWLYTYTKDKISSSEKAYAEKDGSSTEYKTAYFLINGRPKQMNGWTSSGHLKTKDSFIYKNERLVARMTNTYQLPGTPEFTNNQITDYNYDDTGRLVSQILLRADEKWRVINDYNNIYVRYYNNPKYKAAYRPLFNIGYNSFM